MRRARALFASLCVAGALSGCPGPKPVASDPVQPGDAATSGSVDPSSRSARVPTRAAEMIPADALLWVEVRSARRLTEILERDRFQSRMPTEYQAVASALTGVFGVDVLDADNLPQLGLDPDGELGFFVLDGQGALGAYAKVNDVNVLREAIAQTASRANVAIRTESVAGGEVFRDKYGKFAVLIRGPFVVLLGTRAGDDAEVDWLETVATLDPGASLATRPHFETVLQTAGEGDDLLAYLNPLAAASKAAASLQGDPEFKSWADEELVRAKQDGAAPERIAELEKQAAESREYEERYRARRKAEAELLRRLSAGMHALGIQAQMKTRGPMGKARAVADAQGLPRRVFRNRQGPPVLPTALGGRPMFMLEASTDPQHLRELMDLFLRTENQSFDSLMAEIEKQTNIPFGKRMWSMLSGDGGFAVTLDRDPDYAKPNDLLSAIGIAAYLQILDADKARSELDKLMANARIDGVKFVKDRKTGYWSFQPTGGGKKFWRRVYVALAGDKLVLTTDPSLVDRIATGKAGKGAAAAPDGAMAAVGRADQSLVYASDGAVIGWLTFGYTSPAGIASISEPPEDAKIPFSRRYKKKKKELGKTVARLEDIELRMQGRTAKAVFDLASAFGMTVVTAAEASEGFVMEGGQFMRARSLVELAELAVKTSSVNRGENDPDSQLRTDLWRERDRLFDELQQIRAEDLERAR